MARRHPDPLSTHILDTGTGKPAADVQVYLQSVFYLYPISQILASVNLQSMRIFIYNSSYLLFILLPLHIIFPGPLHFTLDLILTKEILLSFTWLNRNNLKKLMKASNLFMRLIFTKQG